MQTRPLFRVSSPSRLRYHRIFFFFFYYFPPIFFFLCFFTFSFFFNRHVIRYDDTHTKKNKPNKRNNNTCVLFLVYIYIYFFSFQIDIVNCQFDSYDYHLSPIFQTARRGKKAQKKKRKKERMYLSSEQRMPIVCLLYREGFRCNIDLCFKVCTRLRK